MNEGAAAFSIGADRWPGLTKLVEEAGEMLQVVGKIMATGGEVEHWDGSNLADRLTDELGDLLAAIYYVADKSEISRVAVSRRRATKTDRFVGWHNEARSRHAVNEPVRIGSTRQKAARAARREAEASSPPSQEKR